MFRTRSRRLEITEHMRWTWLKSTKVSLMPHNQGCRAKPGVPRIGGWHNDLSTLAKDSNTLPKSQSEKRGKKYALNWSLGLYIGGGRPLEAQQKNPWPFDGAPPRRRRPTAPASCRTSNLSKSLLDFKAKALIFRRMTSTEGLLRFSRAWLWAFKASTRPFWQKGNQS